MSAALMVLDRSDVLLDLGGAQPIAWHGIVHGPSDAGPLCTQGLDQLTIWAPSGRWRQAFATLAMFKGALPENCLVLTDAPPPLELVPVDGRVAVVGRLRTEPTQAGRAAYSCADLRTDRIMRLLLAGRVRRRPGLEPGLRLHQLAQTPHGRAVLERWRGVISTLFAGGLQGMMHPELRCDLEQLAAAARQGEHAIVGGFHALDPILRDAAEWEEGARRYLTLAAAQSPRALAAVERWLAARTGWASAAPRRQEELRVATARILHWLVDDPWPSDDRVARVLRTEPPP
jgi:hypothetical protein